VVNVKALEDEIKRPKELGHTKEEAEFGAVGSGFESVDLLVRLCWLLRSSDMI
jgi:hypothetical protein